MHQHSGMVGPFVSIIVPTYNRRPSLQRLLDALDNQSYPKTHFEVVVVDDGSTDDTARFVAGRTADFPLRLLEQAHAGPAAARNLAVQAARGTLILFLDDDVVPVPTLVAEHVATHAANPDSVVIGPMSPPVGWPRPVWVRWEEDKLLRQYAAMASGAWQCTARQFYTGNASLARARFLEAGGFDARFQRAEDVELGHRLGEAGATFLFNPQADVLHYASRTFASWCRTPYQYGRYDVIMHRERRAATLDLAIREFTERHPLNRALITWCAGRRHLVRASVLLLHAVTWLGERSRIRRPSQYALSALFSLLYWQGVHDELGESQAVRRLVAAARRPANHAELAGAGRI